MPRALITGPIRPRRGCPGPLSPIALITAGITTLVITTAVITTDDRVGQNGNATGRRVGLRKLGETARLT